MDDLNGWQHQGRKVNVRNFPRIEVGVYVMGIQNWGNQSYKKGPGIRHDTILKENYYFFFFLNLKFCRLEIQISLHLFNHENYEIAVTIDSDRVLCIIK